MPARSRKGDAWYLISQEQRTAKKAQFTLTPGERETLDQLADEHGAALSRVVGAALLHLADAKPAAISAAIEESKKRTGRG